jgi:hypothetical protein
MPISLPALAGRVRRACQDLRKGTAAEAYYLHPADGLLELSARTPSGPF